MSMGRYTARYPTDVYRLYGADGRLLYVGVAANGYGRVRTHSRQKRWWPEVTRVCIIQYADRPIAEAMEARAIRDENPFYNVTRGYFCELPHRPDGYEPLDIDEFEVAGAS